MADIHSKETRSYNMSRIRSKDTRPEMLVRRFLHKNGFRYRLHVKTLPGKPDIVLPKYKTIIQIHGCFWHGHDGCRYYVVPKTRTDWWLNKINGNIAKDAITAAALREQGWKVITVWECELKKGVVEGTLEGIYNNLNRILSDKRCHCCISDKLLIDLFNLTVAIKLCHIKRGFP